MGRLTHGADLLDELTGLCERENIRLGRIEALGAVQKAVLAYYNQETHEYQSFSVDSPREILKLIGNVSIKDDKPFVHAHVTLADETGAAVGGHLMPGTVVFAGEFVLQEFEGEDLVRGFDYVTGLHLWNM